MHRIENCFLICRCFVGEENDMTVEDCIERSLLRLNQHPHEVSRSVSEMKEWVCSKINRPDGTVIRDCMNMYTGGEPFDVCLSNSHEGKKCLCSSELCNGSTRPKAIDIIILAKMSLIYLLIHIFLWHWIKDAFKAISTCYFWDFLCVSKHIGPFHFWTMYLLKDLITRLSLQSSGVQERK